MRHANGNSNGNGIDITDSTNIQRSFKTVIMDIKLKNSFFAHIRKHAAMSRAQESQLEGILDIYEYAKGRRLTQAQIAYILATAAHETGFVMQPVREGFAKSEEAARQHVRNLYVAGKIRVNYALPNEHGKSFYGRGLAQITHEANYVKAAVMLGLPKNTFIDNPDLLLLPEYAIPALVMGMEKGIYTAYKLKDYINNNQTDFLNARRIINGLDKAPRIKKYAENFLTAIMTFELNNNTFS